MGVPKNVVSSKIIVQVGVVTWVYRGPATSFYTFPALIDNIKVECRCIIAYKPSSDLCTLRFSFDMPVNKHPKYEDIKIELAECLTRAQGFQHPAIARLFIKTHTAPSFNGRTAVSGTANRGSNPWGAAII